MFKPSIIISGFFKISFLCILTACSQSKVNGSHVKHENKIVNDQKVQSTGEPAKDFDKGDLDSMVNLYLGSASGSNTGVSIGLFYNGKDYFYNYGTTRLETNNRPDQNSLYEIGSITKTFTSLLLAKAVIDGKVSLNDPIVKYLPDTVAGNPDLKKITIKQLSNHTSGLPRKASNTASTVTNALQPYENYKETQLFSNLRHYKTISEPGTSHNYSNMAVTLLGVLLEKIYNKPYEKLIKEIITIPLHLNETRITLTDTELKLLAQGYDRNNKPVPGWKQPLPAAGAIISSSTDLLKFGKQQLSPSNGSLLKSIRFTQQATFEDDHNKVGLGWHFLSTTKDDVIFHSGGTGGYSSGIYVNLSKSIVLVVLANKIGEGPPIGLNLIQELSRN